MRRLCLLVWGNLGRRKEVSYSGVIDIGVGVWQYWQYWQNIGIVTFTLFAAVTFSCHCRGCVLYCSTTCTVHNSAVVCRLCPSPISTLVCVVGQMGKSTFTCRKNTRRKKNARKGRASETAGKVLYDRWPVRGVRPTSPIPLWL